MKEDVGLRKKEVLGRMGVDEAQVEKGRRKSGVKVRKEAMV